LYIASVTETEGDMGEGGVDKKNMVDLVGWSDSVGKICERNLENVSPVIREKIRSDLNELKACLSKVYKPGGNEIDIDNAKRYWSDIVNKTETLIIQAEMMKVIDREELLMFRETGDEVRSNLFGFRRK
jgi:hypothetical protein